MSRRGGRPRGPLAWLAVALLVSLGWGMEHWAGDLIAAGWSGARQGQACRLDRVLDGDSLKLVCKGRPVEVRLHCIDAPEKAQRPWSQRSKTHLKEMAVGELELVAMSRDRYGRTVGEVFSGSPERRSLNLEQVRSGQAAVYDRYCEDPRYPRAEREAREAKRGIWQRRGDHQRPWTFRHRHS